MSGAGDLDTPPPLRPPSPAPPPGGEASTAAAGLARLTAHDLLLSGVAKIGTLIVSRWVWGFAFATGLVFCVIVNRNHVIDYYTSVEEMQERVAISVASPTVHTRERLLNDRFEQVSWLERELELTNPATVTHEVRAYDAPDTRDEPARPGAAAGISASHMSDTQIKYGGGNDVRQSFELMNGFRDVLRSERARAMLDDRHDVDDNTLDLFSFDTTWMPRGDARGYAAVEAFITHLPEELDQRYRKSLAVTKFDKLSDQDVFDIYSGWLEKVRSLQESNMKTLSNVLDSLDQSITQPGYGMSLRLIGCSELLRTLSSSSQSSDDRAADCKLATMGRPLYEAQFGRALVPPAAEQAMRAIELFVRSGSRATLERRAQAFIATLPAADLIRVSSAAQQVLLQAGNRPNPASWVTDLRSRVGSGESLLRPVEDIVQDCDRGTPAITQPGVSALPSWLLNAFIQSGLDGNLRSDFECFLPSRPNLSLRLLTALNTKLAELRDGALGSVPWQDATLQQRNTGWRIELMPGLALSDVDVDKVSTSCVAATLTLANIVEASTEQPRNHGASLNQFFDFDITKLTEGCSLRVMPLVTTLQVSKLPVSATRARSDKKQAGMPLLKRLRDLLETTGYGDPTSSIVLGRSGSNNLAPALKMDTVGEEDDFHDNVKPKAITTHAYGYSLSPRLRQNVEVKSRQANQFSTNITNSSLTMGGSGGVDYLGVQPEVIGFIRPSPELDSQQGARFGWLVTPRPDKELTWSVPMEQTQLGAVVSLPSWWRSALLQICTRFVPTSSIGDVLKSEFWSNTKTCRVELIRLPGSAIDVSRRLGMDVLTTPYQEEWEQRPVLHAGLTREPTHLLINGERLWRNTVVTLGGQKADQIEVMPDMVGIIATFRCIRMPTNSADMEIPGSGLQSVVPDESQRGQGLVPDSGRAGPSSSEQPGTGRGSAEQTSVSTTRLVVGSQMNSAPRSASQIALEQRSFTVPVVVWTSEGHTKAQYATVKVGGKGGEPCPASPPNSDVAPVHPPGGDNGVPRKTPG